MKYVIKFCLIILLITALLVPIKYSYAIEKNFFEIAKTEVTKSEQIEMKINIDEIEYENFIFELQSSENIKNVEVDNSQLENEDEALDIEKTSDEIVIEISKEKASITTISLYYKIPETLEINNTIKFVAKITNLENEEESQIAEVEVKIVEKVAEEITEGTTEEMPQEQEQKQENFQENFQENGSTTTMQQMNQQLMNQENMSQNTEINNSNSWQTSGVTTNMSTQNTIQEEIYNGSSNNYLSALSVEGYTLNKEFSKDKSTYFLTVENEVEALNIIATPEEESATVCIYGNENIGEGTNKILISVTAENGNVRNYRIYVTKNS